MRPPSTDTTFNAINHSRSACDRQAGKRNSWHFRTIKMYLSSSYMEKVNVYVTTEKRKNSQKPVKAMLSYKCSLQKPHRHCICLVLTNFCISKLLTNNLLILVNQKRFRKSEEQNTQQFRTYRQGQFSSVQIAQDELWPGPIERPDICVVGELPWLPTVRSVICF